jgi:RimJ/RimL family protein N-acetyltransferase
MGAIPFSGRVASYGWQDRLPTLCGRSVVLRELRKSDAESLVSLLTSADVMRFISSPPGSVDAFEKFIAWTQSQRVAGTYACFAVTPAGRDTAVGIFQIRATEPRFQTAEWGFALGAPFWGSGLFQEAAALVLEFAFETLGVHRLEARAAVGNGRGNAALRKIGAVREGVLRKSSLKDNEYLDQALFAIVDEDWRASRVTAGDGARHVARPFAPRPWIQPRAAQSGVFERKQVMARGDARAAVAHDMAG